MYVYSQFVPCLNVPELASIHVSYTNQAGYGIQLTPQFWWGISEIAIATYSPIYDGIITL